MYYPIRNSLFDEFFRSFEKEEGNLNMKTDIRVINNNYVLDIEMPGYEKKDIDVSLEDGYLTIKAKRVYADQDKSTYGEYVRRERFVGTCSRSYYVGDINENDVTASLNNGILSLTFPKESKAVEHKRIISID